MAAAQGRYSPNLGCCWHFLKTCGATLLPLGVCCDSAANLPNPSEPDLFRSRIENHSKCIELKDFAVPPKVVCAEIAGLEKSMLRSEKRLRFWCLTALTAVLLLAVFQVGLAMAQDSAGDAPAPHESLLGWVARCSGLIGVVILLLSFYFVATVVRLFLVLRESVAAPEELIEQFEVLFQKRDFREHLPGAARRTARSWDASLPPACRSCRTVSQEARNTLDRASDAATITMEKSCSMLAVLGTLGPMIGLLGTLQGMIHQFQRHRPVGDPSEGERRWPAAFRKP